MAHERSEHVSLSGVAADGSSQVSLRVDGTGIGLLACREGKKKMEAGVQNGTMVVLKETLK